MSENSHFSALRVFIGLFILTALEVGWAFLPIGTIPLRLGLLVFAFWKGYLIFMYFMHMRFEGWVVKGLIAPTIPLVAIVVFATMPDGARNKELAFPVSYQVMPDEGRAVDMESAAVHRGYGAKHEVLAEEGGAEHGGGEH